MTTPAQVGPILFARGVRGEALRLGAVTVLARHRQPAALRPMDGAPVEPVALATLQDRVVWRHDFDLPAASGAFYSLDGIRHPVAADLTGDLRIAYVSCNGRERGDEAQPAVARNRLWHRLGEDHARAPFGLLLHGGDQLYADEVLGAHPDLAAWAAAGLDEKAAHPFTEAAEAAAEAYLLRRYAALYAQPEIARLLARVPSVMMWDDHDIFDGWGSHPATLLDSPVGRGLFALARRMFLLFQAGTAAPPPDQGASLTTRLAFPGFDVVAPDLRSERRPDRVLGPAGWAALTRALAADPAPRRRLLMSSVPLLGPRLSWIERLIGVVPKLRRYEDDLRDQWQSRAHRAEWQRLLRLLEETAARDGAALTVLSGEIHLATRAEMPLNRTANRTANGAATLHQLVASGIVHPPPPAAYARALGWLAALGEDPLPGQPIRLHPLPGRRRIYTAERNYLTLERRGERGGERGAERWTAVWHLEDSGPTPPLEI